MSQSSEFYFLIFDEWQDIIGILFLISDQYDQTFYQSPFKLERTSYILIKKPEAGTVGFVNGLMTN